MKKEESKKLSAVELPAGGIVEAGTAVNFHTGGWRSIRPVWNKEKCINCLACWISCPDGSIKIVHNNENTAVGGIDYDYCKGCGICAKECPPKIKAISMEQEKK